MKIQSKNINNGEYNSMVENSVIVSVIIPVYNTSEYLIRCLDSILNQTLKNIEVIIINDGSTDQSEDIIKEYSLKDSRIKAFNQKNQGVSVARNLGIKYSKGEYLIFVDSDDYIHTEMFEELVNASKKNRVAVAKCDVFYIKTSGIKKLKYEDSNIKVLESLDVLKHLYTIFDETHYGYTHSKLYKRDLIINNNLNFTVDMSFAEDTLFFLEACILAGKVVYVPKQLYFYNLTNVSLTRTYIKNLGDKYKFLHSNLEEKMMFYDFYESIEPFYTQYKVNGIMSIFGNEVRNASGNRQKVIALWRSLRNIVSNNKKLFNDVKLSVLSKLSFKKRCLYFFLKIFSVFIK